MLLWVGALLAGCGGGSSSDAFLTPATGTGGTTAAPNVASVTVTASQPTILADGTQTATISAFVRDATNTLLKGVTVSFAADSGALEVRTAVTGTDGVGTAILSTPGNSTPRTITVTATAGTQKATTTVQVITAPPPATVGSLTLTTSTPTIPSDGSTGATISATVRDTSNRFIANVPVTITASSGGITLPSGPTNASGTATATLTAGNDFTNRTITVTATAQGVTQTINVAVIGTRLSIQGPSALNLGQTGSYTLSLIDSSDHGIPGKPIVIASARGNALTAATPLTTGFTGTATFTMNVTNPGNDTITATTLGLTATAPVAVNSDSFTFTTPAANAEVNINTNRTVTVRWLTSGAPVNGQRVDFATTRGTLSAAFATTNASGDATVTVSSPNAGLALVTATGGGGIATANQPIEFVATTPATIVIQPDVFTLGPNEQATLTAVVRDALPAGNPVKNQPVTFSILTDSTGGTLSLASAVTNSQGRASTVYTAGSTTSAVDGVKIAASVTAGPTSSPLLLTVATKAFFISLGTGNAISEDLTGAQYIIPYVVQVTDANGNGVPNQPVQMSVRSITYLKGKRAWTGTSWTGYNPVSPPCADEDTNQNGQLDAGEDTNASGRLEAGNIALVSPNTVTTNAQGFANVTVLYPQEYAYWLNVELKARVAVAGTEFARTSRFLLPGLAGDFNALTTAPPGPDSPFGIAAVCADPN
jgi:hypothetical protein